MKTTLHHNTEISFRENAEKEPSWLYDLRKTSWESFHSLPLPDRVAHLWRYTKPENFVDNNLDSTVATGTVGIQPVMRELSDSSFEAEVTSNFDGTQEFKISTDLTRQGVILESLAAAAFQADRPAANYLGKLIGFDFGKFEAANLALWKKGVFLCIPDNVVVEKPIRMSYSPTASDPYFRVLIVIGKHSRATVIDDYSSGNNSDKAGLFNGVTELFADDYAQVRYITLQNMPSSYNCYFTQRARLGRETSLYSIYGGLGGGNSKANVGTILAGPRSDSRLFGVVFADHSQHFDYHTLHHHQAEESYSNIDFKVILKNKSTSAYTGLIKIDEKTRNCQAYQINRNLLLNKGPRAESIPELEILTDEVQCTHGATMGPLDPDMLFYLKSRGFNHEEAVRMIIEGFIEPTAAQIPSELGDTMRRLVFTKLEGGN